MAHTQEIHRTKLTSESLRRLLATETNGQLALSLYLSFAPSQLPNLRERHMQASSLLAEAEHRHEQDTSASHEQRMALREDIERVRRFVADEHELAPASARGLAIFSCAAAGIFELVSLPDPVEPQVSIDTQLHIEPLLEQSPATRWCVLLLSHRASRVFVGDRDGLLETTSVLDDVHGRHAQGGWSQSRYQRGIEQEVDEHIRKTCALLFERLQRRPFGRLLIGGPEELHHQVEGELHPDVRKRLAGFFEIDVERASPDEVHRRAAPLIEADERAHELQALERLQEGLAPGGHAAVGLEEVLELLNERRVEALLMPHGFTAAGFVCPSCGRLSATDEPCPLDRATPEPKQDIVESAITLAYHQDAEVLVVRYERDQLAGLAALLRF
ncbi:MAG TPA: Vms1/Ankzf1 family peptidyl-tRNA hydrolase [Solirubrobacteraceae bacterium]|nr:Vms1/Ankzf1 family peptidyl-tRNA hydrolase [Solirubrobacteraceae bacterium]